MNCLIIDDEPLAREGLAEYVQDIDFLNLVAGCENAVEATNYLKTATTIDLLFLDIQMPKMTGLDFLKTLDHPPLVIITTAYPSFALESYQLDVLDYLVKPITFPRFLKAANKAKSQYDLITKQLNPANSSDYFFVKCDQQLEKIRLSELLFVEAMQNYVHLYTTRGKFTTLLPLKSVAEELPESQFIQTHRSFIVAAQAVESIDGNLILIGKHRIPISRSLQDKVKKFIIRGKLLKK